MTKEELLRQLADFNEEELEAAVQAAIAAKKAREEGFYFLHHFFQQDRFNEGINDYGVKIPINSLVMNPNDMVHGGVIAFLADNAMGFASYMEKKRPGVTLDLNVRYLKPGRGKQLTAIGEVVSSGSLFNSLRTDIMDETGMLVATATGAFYHRKPKD